jgi:hypothetical protein
VRHSLSKFALVFTAACLSGCGYVGEPLYPALKIPGRVTNLSAVERGDHLEIEFAIPPLTTEGVALTQIGAVELRVGPNTAEPFNTDVWAASARRVDVATPAAPGSVHAEVPIGDLVGKDVIVGVRASNARGRFSGWSNLVTLSVQPPLAKPAEFTPRNVREGVQLSWRAPQQSSFRIYRQAENELRPSLLASATEQQYVDATTQYGKKYEYYVQGVNGAAESEIAGPVIITPKDVFPPAVPADVTAVAGVNSIELAWERNSEADFRGYRIYRATGDGAFARIADLVEAPNYSDKNIESGKRYRYAVTSVDQLGNESERSQSAEATAP